MQATSGFQPQYLQQQPPCFNQEMRQSMSFAVPPDQQIQQQQPPYFNQEVRRAMYAVPPDQQIHPKDNKYAIRQTLLQRSAANGQYGNTSPLTNSTAQTESRWS
jgi:hypothetical protein